MGGQACVFYGAAEFSGDCDIVIIADDDKLIRLDRALAAAFKYPTFRGRRSCRASPTPVLAHTANEGKV